MGWANSIIASTRPTHWVKNLVLFAALFFSGNLFSPQLLLNTSLAVVMFSLAASACYLFNDVADIKQDRLHPVKRKRLVAQGKLPIPLVLFCSSVLVFLSLFFSSFISFFLFLIILAYILLQIAYTLWLKNIVVIDILSIAGGFILRVWAGAFVSNIHMSVWFMLCVISVSLFLASGKRKAELTLLESYGKTRNAIYNYAQLDSYLSIFATSSFIAWALFTFFEPAPHVGSFLPFFQDLPLTLGGIGKWLMITIPVVIFGIMRYLHIIYSKTPDAESPERILIADRPLLFSVIIWGLLVLIVIYSKHTTDIIV